MKLKTILPLFLLILSTVSFAQNAPLQKITDPYFKLVRPEFKGDLAYETVAFVEQYWRVAGNTGFNNTVYQIAEKLEAAGYVLEEKATDSDRFTYRIETREMRQPTWEPVSSSLKIVGKDEYLLSSETNRNMIYMYSSSTPSVGVKGEVVYISTKEELDSKEISGKILFSDQLGYRTLQSAIKDKGAIGVLTYDMPVYLQPEKNVTSIQFRGLRYDEKILLGRLRSPMKPKKNSKLS